MGVVILVVMIIGYLIITMSDRSATRRLNENAEEQEKRRHQFEEQVTDRSLFEELQEYIQQASLLVHTNGDQ